jgi:CheY-like chemotaxis protein
LKPPKTILVVDDEVPIRRVLEMKLKNAGYRILSAADGETALNIIRSSTPDAVITDFMLPKLDGRALCEQCGPIRREHPFLMVMVSGRILPGERAWAEPIPDTVFMEKPFSPTKLLDVVNSYFGISS